jgi:hypothetical protein
MDRFEVEGMESLFDSEPAKRRRRLPPAIRRLIVQQMLPSFEARE